MILLQCTIEMSHELYVLCPLSDCIVQVISMIINNSYRYWNVSNDIKLSMYAKNSNKIDLWTTGIVSLKMQEIIHHENFLQIHASALHSVEPYWSEYDTLGRVGRGPLILMVFPQIVLLQCDPEDSFTDCTMYNAILRFLLWILLPRCCTHSWQNLTLV